MENLNSYLKWRGDITFTTTPFNEVDNLILCALSYLNFTDCINYQDILSLEELFIKYQKSQFKGKKIYENSEKLFQELVKTARFKNVKIARYKRINDELCEKQFGAMTFILPTNVLFITFCGTDATIVGWKEDFNLSYLEEIPAQTEAKNYLEEICQVSSKPIIIGGHSKGGNLAMYATIFCNDSFKKQIIRVYNNDGPGLHKNVFQNPKFLLVKNKIITYLPKFSVVGYLLYNETTIKLIKSYNFGILEHDLFSWQIEGPNLVTISHMDSLTKTLIQQFNQYIDSLSLNKKKKIIDTIFEIFTLFHIKNIEDFANILPQLPKILKEQQFDLEDITLFLKVINLLWQLLKVL